MLVLVCVCIHINELMLSMYKHINIWHVCVVVMNMQRILKATLLPDFPSSDFLHGLTSPNHLRIAFKVDTLHNMIRFHYLSS